MRRITVVFWVGIFPTVVLVYLWGLSGKGSGEVFVLPGGAPAGAGDLRWVVGASFDKGSVIFIRTRTDRATPSLLGCMGWGYSSFADNHSFSPEDFPLPTWGEIAKGRFEWESPLYYGGSMLSFPFWVVVVPVLGGTVAGWRALRRREERMMGAGLTEVERREEADGGG